MTKRKHSRRRAARRQNISVRIITCVVAVLLVIVSVRSYSLYQKKLAYNKQEAAVTKEIASEEARSKEIDAYEAYVGTNEFVEQIARDRLGLAYPNEILFRPEE